MTDKTAAMRLWRRRSEHKGAPGPSLLFAVAPDLDRGAAMLGRLSWTAWRRFEADMRQRTSSAPEWMQGWWSVSPDVVAQYCSASKEPVLTAALLSMHANGYVRESAVRQLVSMAKPDAIPALILRATDWVPQVRQPAIDGLRRLRATLGPAALLPAFPLLEPPRWLPRARADALEETRTWLLANVTTEELVTALLDGDPKVRQAAARCLVERGTAGPALATALEQSDPATATIVANGMSSADWTRPRATERALGSKFSAVVDTALVWLQVNDPQRAVDVSITALMSRSATTRFLAQRYLRTHDVDPRPLYRSALASRPELALPGLAEVGDAADAELIAPCLNAPRPAQRAAAATALGRLAGRAAEDRLCEVLTDPSPRVARSASWALIRLGPSASTIERAWQMTVDHQSSAARIATFRLFRSCDRWTALRLACRGVGSHDVDLDERCRGLLASCMRAWNRSFTSPPASAVSGNVCAVHQVT